MRQNGFMRNFEGKVCWRLALLGVVLCAGLTGLARATEPVRSLVELTALERTRDGFYGALSAAGKPLQVVWGLPSELLPQGSDSVLSLEFSNVLNPAEVTGPDLATWPEFQPLFRSISAPEVMVQPGRVVVRYVVQPRNVGAFRLPETRLLYYLPFGRCFQTTYVEALPYTVVAVERSEPNEVPLSGPPEFFHMPLLRTTSWYVADILVSGFHPWLTVGGLSLLLIWVVGYRLLCPTAVLRQRLKRNKAVRQTLQQLKREPNAEARRLHAIFQQYLHQRHGFTDKPLTPHEVQELLPNFPALNRHSQAILGFLRASDAARYGPMVVEQLSANDLGELILNIEGVTT